MTDLVAAVDQDSFEVRADHVEEQVLREHTATGDWFDQIHKSLIDGSLVLLAGPRGCGKTHMMRYTWLRCIEDHQLPLGVYVSFNRYLRLEPLLKTQPDAVRSFQLWVLARILMAMADVGERLLKKNAVDVYGWFGSSSDQIKLMVAHLEKASPLGAEYDAISIRLSPEHLVEALIRLSKVAGRRRVVLMLDDAALTLTPDYLFEFFDTVRVLKRGVIAPKCSVYPGTTEYGPRFHAHHEGVLVPAWLSTDSTDYLQVMEQIGAKRYPGGTESFGKEAKELLMYAAFGVPRAYLSLLREYSEGLTQGPQAAINNVVRQHYDSAVAEFRSLGTKMPRFATIVRLGEKTFREIVRILVQVNIELADQSEKQTLIGVDSSINPLQKRMFDLLAEAGLLYEHSEVSHGGADRRYRRFTPHLSALIALRAFSSKSRGVSPAAIVSFLQRKAAKHPVRRNVASLLTTENEGAFRLDLPNCQVCDAERLSDSQRYCHSCGNKLADPSMFYKLMALPISEVTNLTSWQRDRVLTHGLETIGDVLSLSDPGTELRKIHLVGSVRAQRIFRGVEEYVDEFLS